MKRLLFSALLILSLPAAAQIPAPASAQPDGEILAKPICSALINRSQQSIIGSLSTQKQALADGTLAAHRDNFKLLAGEKKEFCVNGPFFQGRRIELVLRTVVPLFSCKTKIEKIIYLDADIQPDGTRKLSATCQ